MNQKNSDVENVTDERSEDLQIILCNDGRHINVRNEKSGSGEFHTVHLDESGSVERCTCLGYVNHGHCYHVDSVSNSPILQSSAKAISQSRRIVTDGGVSHTGQCEECGREGPLHDGEPVILHAKNCSHSEGRTTTAQYKASKDSEESTGIQSL